MITKLKKIKNYKEHLKSKSKFHAMKTFEVLQSRNGKTPCFTYIKTGPPPLLTTDNKIHGQWKEK